MGSGDSLPATLVYSRCFLAFHHFVLRLVQYHREIGHKSENRNRQKNSADGRHIFLFRKRHHLVMGRIHARFACGINVARATFHLLPRHTFCPWYHSLPFALCLRRNHSLGGVPIMYFAPRPAPRPTPRLYRRLSTGNLYSPGRNMERVF